MLYIEHNLLFRAKGTEGRENVITFGKQQFCVLTIYFKNVKDRHICHKEEQAWKRGMVHDKFRLLMQMVTFDYSSRRYQDTDIETSKWSKESLDILVDASGNINVIGSDILDN